ncbi:Annexin_9 [Hexamita inflata]|uniref:Annexin 9 n=1 Tax=Hexamita inflata TaxID=28002 RepID=A0AA86U129_9EUKA|nr:Annexin 9 [Hexamita inflata]
MSAEPNYDELCTKLFKTFKGLGTDEKTITSVLATLTNEQIVRKLIPRYQTQQSKNFVQHLQSELSGNMKNLLSLVCTARYETWARALDQQTTNKRQPHTITRFIALIDHQDRFRILQQYQAIFNTPIDNLLSKIKDVEIQTYAKAVLLNEYEVTDDGINQFCQDCKGSITSQQLFEFLACCDTKSWPKFTLKFKQVTSEDFTTWTAKNFQNQLQIINIHAKALENPVTIISELLYYSMKGAGTDDDTLQQTTAIFRDYHWKDLPIVYKQFGDITKDFKSDLTGKYEECVLRLWGCVWF